MKLQLRHIRHPLRTLSSATRLLQAAWGDRRFVHDGHRHFHGDTRYQPSAVHRGFETRISSEEHDIDILNRICRAYAAAIEQQQKAPAKYAATQWWEQQRALSLGPVMQALRSHDVKTLQRMYRNFFRDDCATGLIPVQRMKQNYFGQSAKDFCLRLYLIDALYRLDYWREQTNAGYSLGDLAGPAIGNPFGVMLDGTLIRNGADYQHYCAHRVASLLLPGQAVVMEIGGGFGGMAYYLLRDRPETTYIDFDTPESIALTSYYLMKAFPDRQFVLFGEAELDKQTLAGTDVVLMPLFQIDELPRGVVHLTVSSHAMSDLSPEILKAYLEEVARSTRQHFLFIGNEPSAKLVSDWASASNGSFTMMETRTSGWSRHIAPRAEHVESIWRLHGPITGAAARDRRGRSTDNALVAPQQP